MRKNSNKFKMLFAVILSLSLLISNLNVAFAGGYEQFTGWTCISQQNTRLSVGEQIYSSCDVYDGLVRATYYASPSCSLKSNFDFKVGDKVDVQLDSYFGGSLADFDYAASYNYIQLVAENGTVVASYAYELAGTRKIMAPCQPTNIITSETQGKLTMNVYVESPGRRNVTVELDSTTVLVTRDGQVFNV